MVENHSWSARSVVEEWGESGGDLCLFEAFLDGGLIVEELPAFLEEFPPLLDEVAFLFSQSFVPTSKVTKLTVELTET